ncbi:GNAT family N-acetyltransferase [Arthrobacter sp. AK01]|uniref:GNAT family N-acetyltransferase n=1 Tax=Arthrobacter sp. AK01 TaxID=2894084 RepID=UPI001E338A9F|nr:GNAT family N-acetyltransferase [Arthrobacter sp. AK01]MCD4850927.1 GNAT family N-acetyltransferase [Arthrobacter sp. AK01]
MVDQATIETLMDKAWPAIEREDLECDSTVKWVLRASEGVTQRANSVWPMAPAFTAAADSDVRLTRSVRTASEWYRRRRLPLIFQVFDDSRSAALNGVLDRQRFTRQSETKIMVRGRDGVPANLPGPDVELSDVPSAEWLSVWWSVDGRGGDPELSVAQKILSGCPAAYALVRDDAPGAPPRGRPAAAGGGRDPAGVPAAGGRLALVDGWGGIYSMATSVEHRRKGYGTRVLNGLLEAGAQRGLEGFWLLVTAANHGAQGLYAQAGFTEHGSYLYRQAPLKRSVSGC